MTQTYRIRCLSTALSPITHMSGTSGNEAIIHRERVATPTGIRYVPALSGNALRSRMVREPGARFLVRRWGLEGKLSMRQLNFLFHGGSLTEGTNRQDTGAVADLQRLLPLVRLVGGCLPDAILPGSLTADRGVLVCRENAPTLRGLVPWEVPGNLRPAEDFVDGYQYTRGDARNSAHDLLPAGGPAEGDATNLMIFSGQSVIRGATFVHGFVARNVSELEVGAMLLSMALWRDGAGAIGGQSARGHGRLDTFIHSEPDVDEAAMMAGYVAHVDAVRDDAVAWLGRAFAAKAAKPAKAKGGRAVAVADA